MPKYDYRCSACGSLYEKREGFDAPVIQACPSCSGEARRVFSAPSIVFKGSGWYKTDSRGAEPAATPATTTATAAPEGESKPAAPAAEPKAAVATTDTAAAAE